jgi:hypothetical protein
MRISLPSSVRSALTARMQRIAASPRLTMAMLCIGRTGSNRCLGRSERSSSLRLGLGSSRFYLARPFRSTFCSAALRRDPRQSPELDQPLEPTAQNVPIPKCERRTAQCRFSAKGVTHLRARLLGPARFPARRGMAKTRNSIESAVMALASLSLLATVAVLT